jgi:hypothetical protein
MAKDKFTFVSFLWRLLASLALILLTYNPAGVSWFHWARADLPGVTPLMALSGLALLIGWTVYVRATVRSLGALGLFLAFAFFGTLIWLVVDVGLVPVDSVKAVTWLVLVLLAAVLAVGVSWSHVRRRLSGQVDTDEIEG